MWMCGFVERKTWGGGGRSCLNILVDADRPGASKSSLLLGSPCDSHVRCLKFLITKDKPVNPLGCHCGRWGARMSLPVLPPTLQLISGQRSSISTQRFDSEHSLHRKFIVVVVHLPLSAINKPSIRQPSTPLYAFRLISFLILL